MTIALGPPSWLRTQAVEVLKLIGHPDPTESASPQVVCRTASLERSNPVLPHAFESRAQPSPLLKHQAALAANPNIWCLSQEYHAKVVVNDEHQAEVAAKLAVGDRVVVEANGLEGVYARRGEVMFIGKIGEVAPGYWIGVEYDEPVGRNDGSVKGRRLFDCLVDHGGFVRPDKCRVDLNPPPKIKKPRPHDVAEHHVADADDFVEPVVDGSMRFGLSPIRRGSSSPKPALRDPANTSAAHGPLSLDFSVSTPLENEGPVADACSTLNTAAPKVSYVPTPISQGTGGALLKGARVSARPIPCSAPVLSVVETGPGPVADPPELAPSFRLTPVGTMQHAPVDAEVMEEGSVLGVAVQHSTRSRQQMRPARLGLRTSSTYRLKEQADVLEHAAEPNSVVSAGGAEPVLVQNPLLADAAHSSITKDVHMKSARPVLHRPCGAIESSACALTRSRSPSTARGSLLCSAPSTSKLLKSPKLKRG